MKNAVFLDRDGTLIVDPEDERVDSVDKIKLFPDTLKALNILKSLDYEVFIVTNQAGISEARLTINEFWKIHSVVLDKFEDSESLIRKTYMCPHGPNDNCNCRKPKPKLILDAAKEYDINLSNSWFVGDHDSDIQAGKSAGVKTILVKTALREEPPTNADYTADTLLDAISYITSN